MIKILIGTPKYINRLYIRNVRIEKLYKKKGYFEVLTNFEVFRSERDEKWYPWTSKIVEYNRYKIRRLVEFLDKQGYLKKDYTSPIYLRWNLVDYITPREIRLERLNKLKYKV